MKRSTLSPVDILVNRDRQSRFWFVLFLVATAVFIWQINRLTEGLNRGMRFVIMSDDSYYLPKSVDFQSAKEVHAAQVTLAMETLFDRNPKGLDNPQRLKRLFDKASGAKAQSQAGDESAEFVAKSIHQKVETGSIQLLQINEDSVLASAEGQLIRTGIFDGDPFTEALAVEARFTFARNPDMLTNGGFPTVVTAFDISTSPVTR
ncbi:MAG: hypothetical protein KDN22_07110 [Verrucomicrobiae bacterium]|nr:hypothetical protein [Verrucomicrobiae bacterium]